MTIHYYKVKNCTLDYENGKPVLVAPESTAEEALKSARFVRSEDESRWIHFLTELETVQIQSCFDETIVFKKDNDTEEEIEEEETPEEKKIKSLSLAGIAMVVGSWIIPVFSPILMLASFIIMLFVRIKHKKNKAGIVLMWCWIGSLIVLGIIIGVVALAAYIKNIEPVV